MDTDDDEVDDGFEIPNILIDVGVMQMEMVMMNEGLKGRVVDVAVVELEYMKRIQHDGLCSSSEQLVDLEADLLVESELRR